MKKFILSAFLLGSFAIGFSQTISFDKTTENYGDIMKGANGNRIFKVTNKGDKPLIISNVKPACGCTTPEWKTDPILPGASSDIKVGYNTTLVGPFNKQIEVFSNDPENGRAVLTITGKVQNDEASQVEAPIILESKTVNNVKTTAATEKKTSTTSTKSLKITKKKG